MGKKTISYNFLNALSNLTGESIEFWLYGNENSDNISIFDFIIDEFINDGSIKEDGSYDEETLKVFISLINKRISSRLKIENK